MYSYKNYIEPLCLAASLQMLCHYTTETSLAIKIQACLGTNKHE